MRPQGNDATDIAPPHTRYGWYVVAVLIVAYTFSYIDRQILTLMVQPIKASLHISDVQVSLLHGLAFAIFYTALGIPIARLADRHRRTSIISGGVLIWSVMTALCAAARSFGQLFALRIGVGVGEAALGPAAYSIIADSVPPRHLARALSVYTAAIYAGAGLAAIAGGALIAAAHPTTLPLIGRTEPWQFVFLLVGLPGVLIALWTSTLREPARRGLASEVEAPSVSQVSQYIIARKGAYFCHILGFSTASLAWNGITGWIPTHFIRTFHWTAPEVGLRYGLALLVFGTAGTCFGGIVSGWLRQRGRTDSNLLLGIIAAALSIPFGVAAPLMPTAGLSLAVYCLFLFAGSMPYGGAAAALQEITPNRMRAQVTALYFFGLNLAGIGLGPTVVALFTDKLFGNEMMLRYALALTVLIGAPLSILLLGLGRRAYRQAFEDFQART